MFLYTKKYSFIHICTYGYMNEEDNGNNDVYVYINEEFNGMWWLRLVGSLKLWVSFAKEPHKIDNIWQKRPMI